MLDKQKRKAYSNQARYTWLALLTAFLSAGGLYAFEDQGCCTHTHPDYVTYDSLVLPPDFIAIHPFNYYGSGISRIGLLLAVIAITWGAITRQHGYWRGATIFFVLVTLLFLPIWDGYVRFKNTYFHQSTTAIGGIEYHVAQVGTGDGHSRNVDIQHIVYTCTEPIFCRIQFVSDVIVRQRSAATWSVSAEDLPRSPEVRLVEGEVGVYSYDVERGWMHQKVLNK